MIAESTYPARVCAHLKWLKYLFSDKKGIAFSKFAAEELSGVTPKDLIRGWEASDVELLAHPDGVRLLNQRTEFVNLRDVSYARQSRATVSRLARQSKLTSLFNQAMLMHARSVSGCFGKISIAKLAADQPATYGNMSTEAILKNYKL